MHDQVMRAIEALRPSIQADGGDLALRHVDERTGVVTVELVGACVGCPSSVPALAAAIGRILRDRVPGVTAVEAHPPGSEAETAVHL